MRSRAVSGMLSRLKTCSRNYFRCTIYICTHSWRFIFVFASFKFCTPFPHLSRFFLSNTLSLFILRALSLSLSLTIYLSSLSSIIFISLPLSFTIYISIYKYIYLFVSLIVSLSLSSFKKTRFLSFSLLTICLSVPLRVYGCSPPFPPV